MHSKQVTSTAGNGAFSGVLKTPLYLSKTPLIHFVAFSTKRRSCGRRCIFATFKKRRDISIGGVLKNAAKCPAMHKLTSPTIFSDVLKCRRICLNNMTVTVEGLGGVSGNAVISFIFLFIFLFFEIVLVLFD